MLDAFVLSLRPRLRDPFGWLNGLLGSLHEALQSRRRRQAALEDWATLRSMSDRELADLAIGRGDVTREAGPRPRG